MDHVVRMDQMIEKSYWGWVNQSVRSCCCRWYFLIRNRLTAYTISRMDRCTFSPHAATSTLNTRLWPLITLHLIADWAGRNDTSSPYWSLQSPCIDKYGLSSFENGLAPSLNRCSTTDAYPRLQLMCSREVVLSRTRPWLSRSNTVVDSADFMSRYL